MQYNNSMDARSLHTFLTLADTLSFSRTAEQRHLSLSAVSRALQRMEGEVGQRLLERDKRTVRLTPAGERYRDYAISTLAEWQRLLGELRPDSGDLRGEVRVYCSVTASYSVLSPILEQFRRDFPRIEILLHTGDYADAAARVQSGQEDIAVAALPDKVAAALEYQTLQLSPLQFIAPAFACAVVQQLLQQQGLGDALVMVLVENKALQGWAEMGASQVSRELSCHLSSIGGPITRQAITGIARLDTYVLDPVVLIPQQTRSRG